MPTPTTAFVRAQACTATRLADYILFTIERGYLSSTQYALWVGIVTGWQGQYQAPLKGWVVPKRVALWVARQAKANGLPLMIKASVAGVFELAVATPQGALPLARNYPVLPVVTSSGDAVGESNQEPPQVPDARGPLPGTWAFTARMLAASGLMSGDEAQRFKDQMIDELLNC